MAKSASKIPSDRFIALIGDMVKSRDYKGTTRLHIQEAFNRFIARLNRTYRPSIRALFTVTLGDEFQGLVQDPEIIPDLLWEVQREPSLPPFRLGLGYGRIDTKIPARAINLDGPAFHNARAAIQQAKIDGITGAVFQGFGKPCDVIANESRACSNFRWIAVARNSWRSWTIYVILEANERSLPRCR